MASLQAQHFFNTMSPSQQAQIRASWGGADLMDSWYTNAVNAGAVPGTRPGSAPSAPGVDPSADPYASNPAVQAGRRINSDISDAQWAAWERHFDPSCPPEYPFRMSKPGANNECGESPDNCPMGTHQQGNSCEPDGPDPSAAPPGPAAASKPPGSPAAPGAPGSPAAATAPAAPPPKPKSLQDLLLEMFQNRQGVFGAEPGKEKSPYLDANAGGTPGAAAPSSGNPVGLVYGSPNAANPFSAASAPVGSNPLSQALVGAQGVGGGGLGQGLIWYDPNYSQPKPAAPPPTEEKLDPGATPGASTSGSSWVPPPAVGSTGSNPPKGTISSTTGWTPPEDTMSNPFEQDTLSAQLTKQKRQPRQPFAFGKNGVPSWDQAMSGRY